MRLAGATSAKNGQSLNDLQFALRIGLGPHLDPSAGQRVDAVVALDPGHNRIGRLEFDYLASRCS